jgi:uncharacterized membrane protein YkvA (DUF1232 family)
MSFSINSLYTWYRNTLRNPKYRWWIVIGTFVYLFSPFDIAPDFLPIIGQLDDITVLTLLISEISQILIEKVKTRDSKSSGNGFEADEATAVDVEAVSVK